MAEQMHAPDGENVDGAGAASSWAPLVMQVEMHS
jgi:hypothetical protein